MSDTQKILGFDLDDVLLDFNKNILACSNARFGTQDKREDMSEFHLDVIWKTTREQAKERVFEFYNSPEHAQIRPIEGAVEAIQKLKQNNKLFIITSRPDSHRDSATAWLEKYFPNSFEQIFFTNQFHGQGTPKMKSEVCRELGIETFIDDGFYNAEDIAESGVPVLLYNAPWNQSKIKNPLITRVYSWDEIVQKLIN